MNEFKDIYLVTNKVTKEVVQFDTEFMTNDTYLKDMIKRGKRTNKKINEILRNQCWKLKDVSIDVEREWR